MSKLLTVKFSAKDTTFVEFGYMNSSYFRTRVIPELKKTGACKYWEVYEGVDDDKNTIEITEFPDGKAVKVDPRWGLTKTRLITPKCEYSSTILIKAQ